MTQQQIQKILENLPEKAWISTRDISEILNCGASTITSSISSMRNYGEVESKWTNVPGKNNRMMIHRLTDKGRGL